MSNPPDPSPVVPADLASRTSSPEPTGHPVVDEVLASLAALDDTAPAEHVAVLETAHTRLRDALADAPVATAAMHPGRGAGV